MNKSCGGVPLWFSPAFAKEMITHRHLLILLAALLMIACSKEEITSVSSEDASINFYVDADAEAVTRAPSSFDTGKQFRVYAWDDSNTPIIYKITNYDASNIVKYFANTGIWSTTQTFYWPQNQDTNVNFYAYYPVDAPFDTDKYINYSSSPIDGLTDLLYAKQKTSFSTSTVTLVSNSHSAQINFRHAMCKLGFQANVTGAGLSVTINSLQICNVKGKGKFDFPTNVTTSNNADAFGSWDESTISYPTTYTLAMNESVELTTLVKKLHSDRGSLFVIPQEIDAWIPATYSIVENDALASPGSYLKIGCSIKVGDAEFSDGGYVYCPLPILWEFGNTYSYTLTFGGGYDSNGYAVLGPLTVSASITPWTESEETGDVNE